MPLTPQARRLLDRFEELGVKPYDAMTVLEARAVVEASVPLQGEPEAVAEVRELLADGAGGRIPVRLYHPSPDERRPLIVYFHGGGWVTGSVAVADTPCRALANSTGCAVASVEYRRSPETVFPGPAEDCFAAVRWLARNAAACKVNPTRLAVCGDSAGGNLAAAVTLLARDRLGPSIGLQILLYPALSPTNRGRFASHDRNGEGYGLTRGGVEWFWRHYLGPGAGDPSPYAAPLVAEDLAGLPPLVLVAAEYDVLRDEGLRYAERLRDAGVTVDVIDYPGMIHGFFWMAKPLEEGLLVTRALAERIARHWSLVPEEARAR